MKKHIWKGIKGILVLAFIVFVIWAVKLDCANSRAESLRRGMAESADDGQQSGTTVIINYDYIELQNNPTMVRAYGGMRFPNITIGQGTTINSAYIQVIAFAAPSWLHAYDSVACDDVDSAIVIESGTSDDLAEGWANKTTATVLWQADMRNSQSTPDSTCDLASLLQEIVNRPLWKSGNAAIFLFKNLWDVTDSAAYETFAWDVHPAWGNSLFVDYTEAVTETKLLPIAK